MSVKRIVIVVIIAIFVIASFYLVYAAGSKNWPFKTKYQVVVLQTGEVYFGRLSLFPTPRMTNVWLPQQTQDENKSGIQIVPLTTMYFSPENVLYFEPSRISWWSNLEENSQVVQIMEGKRTSTQESQATPQSTP